MQEPQCRGRSGARRLLAGFFAASLLAGCATVRHGGAPEPAFNSDKDLKDLEELFAPAASIVKIGASPNADARNSFIDGRLALYNIRYVRFVRDLGVDKQHLDAATDILLLGINLSSAATSAIRTKTNLALLAAGVTGAKITVDKHFYFDKTIPALISTMNAQRKQVLLEILRGRSQSMAEYPLLRALDDLNTYELAGTLVGAIDVLQSEAAVKDKAADQKIRELVVPTPEQRAEKETLGKALASLAADTPDNLKKINAILTKKKRSPVDIKDFQEAKRTLSSEFREDSLLNLPQWRDAIQSAGVPIN
jgi:hypothetical protein